MIISIIALTITSIPVLNYWKIIFEETAIPYKNDILGFAVFRAIFDISLIYLIYKSLIISNTNLSLIPYFLFIHLLSFAIISILIQFVLWLLACSTDSSKNDNESKERHHQVKWLHTVIRYYTCSFDYGFFLSTKILKGTLLLSYLIGGIISASNFSNSLLLSVYKENPNINNSFQTIFNNDQQLYIKVFILSFVPIFTAYFVSNKKME